MTFKVYLTNPSMRTALFSPLSSNDPEMGALVETGLLAQLFHLTGARWLYARWPRGEVDLVAIGPNQRINFACEIKWSDRHAGRDEDLKALVELCHAHNLNRAVVTTRTVTTRRLLRSVAIDLLPAALFCLDLGYIAMQQRGLDLPRLGSITGRL